MRPFHACVRLDETGRPLPMQAMTCGACQRSWCQRCDPSPASLCPYCNGAEHLVGNPVIDPAQPWFSERLFCERVLFNLREADMPEWLRQQAVGVITALQQRRPAVDREVLVGLARRHPAVRTEVSEVLDAAGLEPLRFQVEVTAEVRQRYTLTEVVYIDDPAAAGEMLNDMHARGELSDGDLEDSAVRVVGTAVRDVI